MGKRIYSILSEFRADEITPISIFKNLKGKKKFIFESGERRNLEGRYSFIAENPYLEILSENRDDKLKAINKIKEELNKDFNIESNFLPFKGGGIGYFGYNSIEVYEKSVKLNNINNLKVPEIRFNFYKRYIAYDHFKNKVYIVDNIFDDKDISYEKVIESQKKYFIEILKSNNLNDEINYLNNHDGKEKNKSSIKYEDSREEFINKVKKAKEYIKKGDIFQVVLSRRGESENSKEPLEIYRRLREKNTSPYMFFLDYEDYQVIGSSPEILVSIKDNVITTNPIAGTRKRGTSEIEDKNLELELKSDEKECAEHVMLVDLSRNDIGRVSEVGTVEIDNFMNIEKFSHVMHITSMVKGQLKKKINCIDALFSCFPAGTVSGAPKIRAMQIINELENLDRGIYSGAIGYLSYANNLEVCIAIRTIILKNNKAYIQAGAGIVCDSIPEKECEEIENKLNILKEVILE